MSSEDKRISKEHSRDEYVFLSKLYGKAGRFEEMIAFVKMYIEKDPNLNEEERSIFAIGYSNSIAKQRRGWRYVNHKMKKEEKAKNKEKAAILKDLKEQIEDEITSVCQDIQNVIDEYLLPASQDSESKAFYLKLKGDYFRYPCEYLTGEQKNDCMENAEECYKEAYEIAEKFPISNSIRLGLALNFSVFYFEIKNMKEEGIEIASDTFSKSMDALEEFENSKEKESLILIKLLEENIKLWNQKMKG